MRYWRVPLDVHEVRIPQGEIHLIRERCKGCEFCVEFCPRGVLRMSTAFNAKGYHYPEVVQPELCVECDLCEVICPDFAIFCVPAEAKADEEAAPEVDARSEGAQPLETSPATAAAAQEEEHGAS